MNIRPIIIGTHHYQWCTNIAAYLFDKYAGLPLLYVGDHVEGVLYEGLEFMQVPCFSEGVWPWDHHFAHGLNSIFDHFQNDLILLLLPDHWITGYVDVEIVDILADFMAHHRNVVRGCVTEGQALYQHGHVVDHWHDCEIWGISPSHQHASLDGGITFCPAIWNPKARALFEPHWMIRECERLGTKLMAEGKTTSISVGIYPPPIRRAHVLHHAQPHTVNLEHVPIEDREEIRAYIPDVWSVIE